MKKFITLILVISVVTTNAQVKKDSVLTDSTPLITVKDYQTFLSRMVMDLPAREADPIRQYWGDIINQRIQQWKQKHQSTSGRPK